MGLAQVIAAALTGSRVVANNGALCRPNGHAHCHGVEDPVAAAHLAHLDDFASTALRPSAMS